ncbi:MAG: hypothetical protein V1755_15025 [Chloroflexota bacterium]
MGILLLGLALAVPFFCYLWIPVSAVYGSGELVLGVLCLLVYPGALVYDPDYLGISRTDNVVNLQIRST